MDFIIKIILSFCIKRINCGNFRIGNYIYFDSTMSNETSANKYSVGNEVMT